ncbi:MAG: hypothetical protein K0S32_3583 [Bacteroidetes bacterium]|jgi:type I restriction enzyme S subunit|nr:hypothetical protein [Bacteroidota bacterium]
MSKNNENKLVQNLRFPNFSEYWKVLPVSEICEVFRGSSLSKSDLDDNGSEPCIHYGELFTKYNEVISVIYSKTNKKDGFRSQVGDVLMPSSDVTPAGLAKASAIMLDDVILGGDTNILRPKKDINSVFLSYLLNRSKREIIKLVSGTTVKHIYPSQIITCRLPIIKNTSEQKKIADCLLSFDKIVNAESQKLEVLYNYRKGLLQNLFPQEGGAVPNIRFPEFREKWKKVKLKDVSSYFNGGSYENDVKEEGKYELITLKSIDTNGKLVSSKRYVDIEVATLTKGTLVMILSEQAPGLLGMTAIIPDDNKYVLNQRVAEIRPNQKVEAYFLSIAINRNQIYFSRHGAGTKVQNISKPNVENYEFLLPEIHEQQKIAASLSSLDELISAQSQKLERLQLHKKGLLQGLFPNLNEVT